MTEVDWFRRVVAEVDRRVSRIDADAWHRPTPCSEWDVHALLNHMAGECAWIPPLLAGRTIADVGDEVPDDVLGDDPQTAWQRFAEEALVAAEAPGVLTRTVHLSFGDATGADYLSEVATDLTIHAWDLARAIGADEQLPGDLVERAYELVDPHIDEWRDAGFFGEPVEVPDDVDRQTRLLAMVGRQATA